MNKDNNIEAKATILLEEVMVFNPAPGSKEKSKIVKIKTRD